MTKHEICVQLREGYANLSNEIDSALDNLSENAKVVQELISLRTAGVSDAEAAYIDMLLKRCVEIRERNLEVLSQMKALRDDFKKVLELHQAQEW